MRSVRWRLVLALILVAWLSVAIVGVLTARLTADRFTVYLRRAPGMPQMQVMMRVMMGAPERTFLTDVRRAIWLAALLGAAVAAVVGTIGARRITAPLRGLADAARRIGRGDLGARVEVGGDDEVGEVARTFNTMADELRRADEGRRQLLADIAHELGTPLTVLQANVEGMLDGVVETSPEKLAALHTQVQILARLTKDLRDLSLAQQGRLPLDRRPLDLAALVREVADLSRPVAEDKGVGMEVSAGASLMAWADRDRMAQVLHNLLANAVRYTESGGRVAISAGRSDGDVQVEVTDTGVGIPPDELPHVFDRFYRVDRSRSRATGGAGLGLAVVKYLVEAHGGRVWVHSTPGAGSTFGFALPAQLPGTGHRAPGSEATASKAAGTSKGGYTA